MADPLYKRRWRVLLDQFAEEYGDGWQSELARKVGLHQTAIGKQQKGVGPSGQVIELAIERLKIDRDFFYDPTLGDRPRWRDHLRTVAAVAPVPRSDDNAHWRKFAALGLAERLGLTSEQLEWVRSAPFRGGARGVDDYIRAAEVVVRTDMPEPEDFTSAPPAPGEVKPRR